MLAGGQVNADLTSAYWFILIESIIGTNFAVFRVFLLCDFFSVNHQSSVLYARHPACNVTRFKKIFRRNCKLNFSAMPVSAMTPVTHDHKILHFCFLLSFLSVHSISFMGDKVHVKDRAGGLLNIKIIKKITALRLLAIDFQNVVPDNVSVIAKVGEVVVRLNENACVKYGLEGGEDFGFILYYVEHLMYPFRFFLDIV